MTARTAASRCPRLLLYAALAGLLPGCALWRGPSPEAERAWQARRMDLERIDRFTLQGRVSAGLFGGGGTIHWRQRAARYDVRLSAPGGAQALRIQGDDREADIRTPQGHWHTDQPDAVMRGELGVVLPVAQLRHWVLGRPAPGSDAAVELDELGRLVELQQGDWELTISEYMAVGARELPRRLVLEGPDLSLKLVVDSWAEVP